MSRGKFEAYHLKKSIFCSKVPVLILVNAAFLLPLPESPVWLLGHRFTYNEEEEEDRKDNS